MGSTLLKILIGNSDFVGDPDTKYFALIFKCFFPYWRAVFNLGNKFSVVKSYRIFLLLSFPSQPLQESTFWSNMSVQTLDCPASRTEGRRRRGQQRMRWLDGITDSRTWGWAGSRKQGRTRKPGVLPSVASHRVGCKWVAEQQCEMGAVESLSTLYITVILFTLPKEWKNLDSGVITHI